MFKRIKGTILGGNFSYYITKDRKYFIKRCKGELEWITKEFNNLVKYKDKINIKNFKLVEPVKYSEEKEYLITKFVDGKRLIEIYDPKIHYKFGKALKEFHEKGFSHSHFELTDIIYKNGVFNVVDVPFFNEKPFIHDLVTIQICFDIFKIKEPWNIFRYNRCSEEFYRGYQLNNYEEFEKEYKKSFEARVRLWMRKGKKNWIKGVIMKTYYKLGII